MELFFVMPEIMCLGVVAYEIHVRISWACIGNQCMELFCGVMEIMCLDVSIGN
jgi:hypothetical protein